MTDVEIQYCVPYGHLDRAQHVQRELLEAFGLDLDGVLLTTGTNGVFTVSNNGTRVYDKSEDGAIDMDTIKNQLSLLRNVFSSGIREFSGKSNGFWTTK